MDNFAADFTINNDEPLEVEYTLEPSETFDCSFELFASGTVWGNIDGDINNQTDLINLLNTKVDLTSFEELSQTVTNNYNELSGNITNLTTTVTDNYNTLSGQISDLNTTVDNNYTSLDNRLTTAEGSILDLTDKITDNTDDITAIQNTINSYGDIVSYNAAYFATANQGALADTSLQPNDNISELVNDVGYITSSSLPTVNNNTITIQKNGVNVDSFTLNQNSNKSINITVPTNNNELINGAGYITSADIPTLADLTTTAQLAAINSGATSTNIGQIATNTQDISSEIANRQNADNNLQSQIDAIVSSSDVFDIVGTYAELQAYDISTVPVNDIIKVLVDSSHDNTATYYRCIETEGIKSWSYIGSEGAYYTKSESDTKFVAKTTTINNIPLSSNITLTASDVNALPDTTVIGNGVLTLQKNGVNIDTFNANATANKSINITVPTDTADLTNGAGFITSASLPTVNNGTLDIQVNGTSVGTFTANQSGNTTANIVVPDSATWGNITGTLSNQIDLQNALNSKYDASNPDGYITTSDLPTNYVTTDTAQDISGRKTFFGEKAIYFKQSVASNKLGFTLYDTTNKEVGGLEYRPNTIDGKALLAINCPASASSTAIGGNYVGFRYWSGINIIAPRPTTNGSYYIPVNVTDGTNTVTANNNGTLNISTLLPDVSNFVTNSSLATTLADYVTNANLTATLSDYVLSSSLSTVATSGSYNDLTNKPTIPSEVTESTVSGWGFTKNTGTVTKVNNISPVNGNVTLTIPDTATWGNITGTLSDQTDLQTALDAKQNTISDLSTIRSGAALGATALQPNDNITELVNNAGYISTTINQNVSVAGNTKDVAKTNPETLYVPNGLIMGGTAAAAGLVTRGLCGVSTPSSTGACNKEHLYINFDGTTTFNTGRQLILQAGEVGTHYGNNLYQFAVPRGDIIKNYCDNRYITTTSTKVAPLRYSRYSIAQVNSTNKFIKLASMTYTQSDNRDFSYLFWVEILEASTAKCYALVRLSARWNNTSYTGHKFEILEKYGDVATSLEAFKTLTYAYSLDTKTHKMTVEIWLGIKNTGWVSYYLRPTECNEYGDYSNTPVTLSDNIWTYYNKSGNASSIASTAITSGLTQVKVTDATGVRNENDLSKVIKTWIGTKAQYDAIATKDANTLYNITDDDTADAYEAYTKSEVDTLIQNALNDALYYKSGDTFESSIHCVYPAFVTSSGTSVRIGITTPKRLDNITSVTCNSLVVNFRKSTGGYAPSGSWNAKANATSITCEIGASNLMYVWVDYDNYGFTNNTPVGGETESFSFTFT